FSLAAGAGSLAICSHRCSLKRSDGDLPAPSGAGSRARRTCAVQSRPLACTHSRKMPAAAEILSCGSSAGGQSPRACAKAPGERRAIAFRRSVALFRSEEHTSELQSRGHLVCRLLLEKKKKYTVSSLCNQ